ncbi:MAG: DUF4011 domain-containing protein [Chromatiaceae bacterium]|jgi:very-short-patch-repair endonuclease|nr:DUF4011 domain-containing protein [Chromatiaceae bacterium]
MSVEAPDSFALDSLETLRRRLLDLSARNRLLNFPHGRAGNVRVIDELPNELHRMLLSEEELRFEPVPEPTRTQLVEAGYLGQDPQTGEVLRGAKGPTAAEWGQRLGFPTSYDLPSPRETGNNPRKHTDRAVQTLLFPSELETRLRALRAKAETAIEETGANICYAAFGFLEWYDGAESDTPRHAPLLLVPVRIAKGRLNAANGTYHYTVAYTGEDILPNLSLREKLRIDFQLALPELDDLTAPEDYFAAVQELVAKPQPRWRVRRWVTVALLNFSKLLMYLDLDPQRWPGHQSITSHPIVSRFFSTQSQEGPGSGFCDEHPIDDIPEIHQRYPLIDDADSSQHSALIDAVQGKNLVIEGPPGTGKSQTITNLIAAALAEGKRVLFVAEKLAALEVVKRRLDRAGLGDFCLELHSHKTQKRKVLDDVSTRLSNHSRYRQPAQIDADIARYEALKDELRQYAELINSPWKRTGLSIHQILAAACRYREELAVDPGTLHPEGFDGEVLTPDVQRQSRDTVGLLADVYGAILAQLGGSGSLRDHPWFGVGNLDLQLFDTPRVCASLSQWQEALAALAGAVAAVAERLGVEPASVLDDLHAIETLRADLLATPMLRGNELLSALSHLSGPDLAAVERRLALHHEIRGLRATLAGRVRPAVLDAPETRGHLPVAYAGLGALGVAPDSDLGTLTTALRRVDELQRGLKELGRPMAEVAISLGHAFTDVIKLNEAGLREFRGLVELVGQLRPPLLGLRGEWCDDDGLDELLPELQSRLTGLQAAHDALQAVFALDRLPRPDELDEARARLAERGLLGWFNGAWRAARRRVLALAAKPGTGIKALSGHLDRLVQYARDKQSLETDGRFGRALGPHFSGLNTPISDLTELRAWYRSTRQRYGLGFGPKVALGDAVIGMRSSVAKGIQSLAQQGILASVDQVLGGLAELRSVFPGYSPLQSDTAALVAADGPLTTLGDRLGGHLKVCGECLLDAQIAVAELAQIAGQLQSLQSRYADWEAEAVPPQWLQDPIDLSAPPERIDDTTIAAAENTVALARWVEGGIATEPLRGAIRRDPSEAMFASLRALAADLSDAWQAQTNRFGAFAELTQLDRYAWQLGGNPTLEGLRVRNQAALTSADGLSSWLDYIRVRHRAHAIGFARLAVALEQGEIAPDAIDGGFKLAVTDLLARQILKEIPALARFSGNAQLAVQKQFRQYDETLKKLQRERIAWRIAQNEVPGGWFGGRVADYTELALLKHECAKKKRHIPLRQLVRRAGNALAALKPCFMMGPMSVAQYLAPGEIAFDLVVMDEASQMKPEDALGAVARGGQLVVVGDPKQLPPTSFFDRVIGDDEDEADATGIAESESILDIAIPMFDARRLRWHYRSQHEHLIAFSNHAFYEGGLVVFPAPYSESDDFGVKWTRVSRGRFVNRRNLEEARVIAAAVRQHLLHRPGESLGVVAMSAEQRDQIERAVEEAAKEDPLFQEAIESNQVAEEPLFIKNLENVQGDERDVVFISCTYGPEEVGGRVFQRFGPINSDVGWRRLNVLFTRSKRRMHVFSSIGADDIILSERSKRGVVAFKEFLAFAESGLLHRSADTVRGPDSDFEVAVASALKQAGFECQPQVGVAGFFIDLAVRDPGQGGRYLMGIECDGASYHSAKSVRDRDRLRQAVLERLGWRIRRIWSTDWYRNPRGEIEPILRELAALKTEAAEPAEAVAEVQEVSAIVERDEREAQLLEAAIPPDLGLREALLLFDAEVIRRQLPDTPDDQRLLRPAMLEALLEFRPATKGEFVEMLPLYLRQATCPQEGRYLDQVLRIIEDAETPRTHAR